MPKLYQINCSLYGGSGYEWVPRDPNTMTKDEKRNYCVGLTTFRTAPGKKVPKAAPKRRNKRDDAK